MSCGVGRRHSLDPLLLWLWRRLAATAPIRPLAWEPPYAWGTALKRQKKKKKKLNHRLRTACQLFRSLVSLSNVCSFQGASLARLFISVFLSILFFLRPLQEELLCYCHFKVVHCWCVEIKLILCIDLGACNPGKFIY